MIEESLIKADGVDESSRTSQEWNIYNGSTERGGDMLNDPNGCEKQKEKIFIYIYIYIHFLFLVNFTNKNVYLYLIIRKNHQ